MPCYSNKAPYCSIEEDRLGEVCRRAVSDRVSGLRVFSRSAADSPSIGPPTLSNCSILVAARVNILIPLETQVLGTFMQCGNLAADFASYHALLRGGEALEHLLFLLFRLWGYTYP